MDNDTMFGILPEYRDQDFYEEHPVRYLITPECKYDSIKMGLCVVPQAGDETEEIVLPVGEFVSTVDYY